MPVPPAALPKRGMHIVMDLDPLHRDASGSGCDPRPDRRALVLGYIPLTRERSISRRGELSSFAGGADGHPSKASDTAGVAPF
ncbi:hypothetical protein OE88DRAFT_332062 [Heliocybe sulcata]|uniref:Uncharacterized protein n=1 Tax=Heliocybe sulcata TaxID=5364 RepID=A0A5C3N8P1_9AGAM|nr:hypothetical protein OE88DRAFT_332062 [Heliocybe sulcata]